MRRMRRQQKKRLLWAVLFLFVVAAVLFYLLPPKGYVPILMYHFVVPESQVGSSSLDVSVDDFRKQMWFLKTFGYRRVNLDELYEIKIGRSRPRGREVVVTFDDGNETYLQYALPIMERYHIQSVNFLIWNYLKQKDHGSMNLEDVKRISNHPLVTLGSHTLTHPNLVEINRESARREVFESKENLEKALGKPIYYFSYPAGFCDPETIKLVEEAGYRLAFTTSRKHLNGQPETPYSLIRIKVSPRQNLLVFWANISGLIHFAKEIDSWFHQLTVNIRSGTLRDYRLRPAIV